MQNIIMTESLSTDAELVRIVPVGHAIHLLKEAESRLKSLHVQPRDVTIVGVRTEQLEAIDVVVARKSSRQARLDTDGLGEETEIERDAAKVLARRLSPMLAQLNNKSLSTESNCARLSQKRAIHLALAPPLWHWPEAPNLSAMGLRSFTKAAIPCPKNRSNWQVPKFIASSRMCAVLNGRLAEPM